MLEFRLLRADEIDARIATCGSWGVQLLLYKDARCDQNILDETVGAMNWQRHHSRENANCIVSIWDEDKRQWIEKEDTGTESFTEKEKGIASDSFKRACFNWGIGRELYTAPSIFVRAADLKTLEERNGKWSCKDSFSVTDIKYVGRKIAAVEIRNNKTGKLLTYRNEVNASVTAKTEVKQEPKPAAVEPEVREPVFDRTFLELHGRDKISGREIARLQQMTQGKTGNESLEGILKSIKKKSPDEITYIQYFSICRHFDEAA